MRPLSPDFISAITRQIGSEAAEALVAALDSVAPVSIRINPSKWRGGEWGEAVPWSEYGRYLESRPQFTLHIPFVAGSYYVQEAGSQFISHILASEPLSGARVLDMCAAPGGKSTLYSTLVGSEGLVLANEYVRNRANILADNIRKWGLGNVVVTNNDPAHIAAFENWFDVVAVDAPCSGEGMFRKDEVAREEWSLQSVECCVQRQKAILEQAFVSLKAGGVLIYSTCTYNDREDEGVLRFMTEQWGDELEPSQTISVPESWGIECFTLGAFQAFRFFPHRTKSEGFFVAVARKSATTSARAVTPKARKKIMADAPKDAVKELSRWVQSPVALKFAAVADSYYCYAAAQYEAVTALAQNLTVIYSGVEMGQIFKGKLRPEWALSQSVWLNRAALPAVEVATDQALEYLRKHDIDASPFEQGLNLVLCDHYPLGFVKRIGARVNNNYPNSLKINTL